MARIEDVPDDIGENVELLDGGVGDELTFGSN